MIQSVIVSYDTDIKDIKIEASIGLPDWQAIGLLTFALESLKQYHIYSGAQFNAATSTSEDTNDNGHS